MKNQEKEEQILQLISEKSQLKQDIFDNTINAFNDIKDILHDIVTNFNVKLKGMDKRLLLEYKDRGKFEVQIRVAGDILIFSMHSNIFEFNREHYIWKTSYAKDDKSGTYSGIINIYNFLADSFKYNRENDLGYLVGRIFINKDSHFMVEGKRMGNQYSAFETPLDKETLEEIITTAIIYSLDFDLLVPPYDTAKTLSVGQINYKVDSSRAQTGKRLGFNFNSDDVVHEGL